MQSVGYKLVSLIFSFFMLAALCYAATPQEEYEKIQKEITIQKKKLEKAKKQEHSVLTDIEDINRQLNLKEAELRKYKKRLVNTESGISKVESEISSNKGNIDRSMEWIKKKLRAIYRYGNMSEATMLFLSADDISQLMRRGKFLQYVKRTEN